MGRASLEGRRRVVLKADLGASGRGQRRTQAWPPDDGDERFAASILRRQGALIIEAWHERVLDLSLHFTVLGPEQVRYDGATRFVVDDRGQYEGSVLGPWRQGLSADVQRALATECPDLDARFQILVQLIGKDLAGRGFLGPASLDSYLYRGPEDGSLHWRALVEINPRWTMGRLALALGRRHLSRRSRGELRVFSGGSVHEEGQRLEAAYPLVMEPQQDRPRIASGALVLSQTTPRTRLAAVLLAGAALEDTRS